MRSNRMSFEVQKKHGRGWRNLGTQTAISSAKAAAVMAMAHGPGTYRVRPEDSRGSYYRYTCE
jgi:hypothetical protein